MTEEKNWEVSIGAGHSCICQHTGTCEGVMHRFCFRRCCMMKSMLAALVLVIVFSAGFCAGHEGHREYDERGYHGGHMMMGAEMQRGWGRDEQYQDYGQYYPAPIQGQYTVIYRTAMPGQTVVTGSSTVAVPTGMPMMRQIPQ